jgi:hypothetical protein
MARSRPYGPEGGSSTASCVPVIVSRRSSYPGGFTTVRKTLFFRGIFAFVDAFVRLHERINHRSTDLEP